MEWVYQTTKRKQIVTFQSDYLPVEDTLLLVEDMEKTGRTKEILFFDEDNREWNKKELIKYSEKIEEEPHDIIAVFDGGFDKDTKLAGLGIAIYYEKNGEKYRIRKNAVFEHIESNNEAEYAALWLLLLELEALNVKHIHVTFKGDSLVVINQMSDEWPCYEEELQKWLEKIAGKIKELGLKPSFEAISRKQNRETDQLAAQALAGIEIASHAPIK